MSKLPSIFKADEHEKLGDFEAIDPGNYTAKIVKSEMVETKNKDGHFLKLQFEVLEGDCKGRMLWTNLNLVNPSDKAMEIAHKALASICEAVGINSVEDSEALHEKPMLIKVTKKAATSEYPEGNEIKGFKAHDGVLKLAAPGSSTKAEGGTTKAPKKMPWAKD